MSKPEKSTIKTEDLFVRNEKCNVFFFNYDNEIFLLKSIIFFFLYLNPLFKISTIAIVILNK